MTLVGEPYDGGNVPASIEGVEYLGGWAGPPYKAELWDVPYNGTCILSQHERARALIVRGSLNNRRALALRHYPA